ncbi:MAG: transglutaminase domain-containing protein [Candidatus Aenigmatarchaeota archaeon]|nr:MAG: transglutaminase domain-containing protein [Candidatus Aenigmarchaeota archaeon]
MLGSWGYRLLVVLLLLVSFLAVSSNIPYTGEIVSRQASRDTLVYECPECEENEEMEEAVEGCKDVLRKYEKKVEDLETEKEILRQRISLFLRNECEIGERGESVENIGELADPEGLRDLAVFIVSCSPKDSVTSLYEYVRMNVKFVKDPEKEYVASPCETILSEGGDCEDHAILLASLLEAVGVDSKVLWITGEHTFVGIAGEEMEIDGLCEDALWFQDNGEKILVADTTFSNCIGRINEDYVVSGEDGWEWRKKPVVFDV